MIETIPYVDEATWLDARKQDVTSTEVAALFGISPYMTAFELWHRKHDNMDVKFEPNERMAWGNRLQDSIAAGIFEDQGWVGRKKTEYVRDTDLKMGASFDFEFYHVDGEGQILEVKNVDSLAFKDGWLVDGDNVEAPPHIELQVQQQLALTGYKAAYIGALVGGNRVVLIKREPDVQVISKIKERIRKFWVSVDNGTAPKPDFSRDSDFISRLYSFAEPRKVFTADERVSKLALAYKQAADEAKAAGERKDAAKAEILTIIGTAEKVIGPWGSISAGMIGPTHVSYDREGYRNFRPSWKKVKP